MIKLNIIKFFKNLYTITVFLKIDGSLIKNIDKDKRSYAFVKSIVELAKELKIQTIAELISTKEIFDVTYALGIDFFQGYYFSVPLQGECISKNLKIR